MPDKTRLHRELSERIYPETYKKWLDKVIPTLNTEILKSEHSVTLDEDRLFGPIGKTIEYLQELKSEGYTDIDQRWSGYEDNYFVATKIENETEDEYFVRLTKEAREKIKTLVFEQQKKDAKRKEIAALQDKIRELQKEI